MQEVAFSCKYIYIYTVITFLEVVDYIQQMLSGRRVPYKCSTKRALFSLHILNNAQIEERICNQLVIVWEGCCHCQCCQSPQQRHQPGAVSGENNRTEKDR